MAGVVVVRPLNLSMRTLVFVFGTLKQGFPNFGTNRGSRIAGRFSTQEAYPLYLVGERYSPWLLDSPGTGLAVIGELYEVTDAVLADMDILERVHEPDGYVRKEIEVVGVAGTAAHPRRVHAYLKRPSSLPTEQVRLGPLAEYLPEHAKLYRRREA